jgi:hypothetical protein
MSMVIEDPDLEHADCFTSVLGGRSQNAIALLQGLTDLDGLRDKYPSKERRRG